VRLSENLLPMNCMSYTDGMNSSVKLFNGVVIGIVLAKVLFIKIHGTVDWSSVMTELPLPQRGAKTVRGGWGCLFIRMHLTLKKWFEKKRSV
jgi:hypothetical protein